MKHIDRRIDVEALTLLTLLLSGVNPLLGVPPKPNAGARRTCWLATICAMVFVSPTESGDRRIAIATEAERTAAAISIVDQNGRPSPHSVPSPNSQIFDVTVGQGFAFVPNMLNIFAGDTVRWTWASSGNSVTSGMPCTIDGQYCSPDDTNCDAGVLSNMGTIYEHTFVRAGTYFYFCHAHCDYGMTGIINVMPRSGPTPRPRPTPAPRP